MRTIRNQDGIALLTALMFTLICLGMIMTLMYYVLAGTKMSAAQKRYHTSMEAAYGGAEFFTKTIVPRLFVDYTAGKIGLNNDFAGANKLGMVVGSSLREKLGTPTALWTGSSTVDPKVAPDVTFNLKGATPGSNYKVYSKIVDTITGVGLLDTSGIDYLDAGIGVAGSSTSTQTLRTPNMYAVEIQGEAAVNATEKASLTVLYAY